MPDDANTPSCCAPTGAALSIGRAAVALGATAPSPGSGLHTTEQALIPAGSFAMGEEGPLANRGDGEGPVHQVSLEAFAIDVTAVTTAQFAAFVAATGYRSDAESFGYSAVFHLALDTAAEHVMSAAAGTPWWLGVRGATWREPGGPGSSIDGLLDHPVVHVSWNDAVAYCAWAGRQLPTEAQWERASRADRAGDPYPWGSELLTADGQWQANIWQGTFPRENTLDDGWLTTAPARSFEPNAFGLYNTVGNVWEWCADWHSVGYYAVSPGHEPRGPEAGEQRVLRGGSFLCHDSYCNRYRTSARSSNTPDMSMSNTGFRTVALG